MTRHSSAKKKDCPYHRSMDVRCPISDEVDEVVKWEDRKTVLKGFALNMTILPNPIGVIDVIAQGFNPGI